MNRWLILCCLGACASTHPGVSPDSDLADGATFVDGPAAIDASRFDANDGDAATRDAPVPVDATVDAVPADAQPFSAGPLFYERIGNATFIDDFTDVRWHPSGTFALLLNQRGQIVRYEQSTGLLSLVAKPGVSAIDLDVAADGSFFLVLGTGNDSATWLWRVTVDQTYQLSVLDEVLVPLGTPRALEKQRDGALWAVGTRTSDSISHVYIWQDGIGWASSHSYNASAGLTDLMWGDASYFGGANVMLGHGQNGADSRTYVLASNSTVANAWPGGLGNPGGGAWRPQGTYGYFTGWSSNRLYVYAGTWSNVTLPGVGTAAGPQAASWNPTGTRAVIVGRAIGPGLSATVIDHRANPSPAFQAGDLVYASIPNFDQAPWFGNGNSYLAGADWRPASNCQEGLMVGSDNGTTLNPTFGLVVRFFDSSDPDC